MTIKDAQVKDGELLPCPFCGESSIRYNPYCDEKRVTMQIYCPSCFAGVKAQGWPLTIQKWNTRIESPLQSQLAIAREALEEVKRYADYAFAKPFDMTARCGDIAEQALKSLSLDNPAVKE